MWRPHLHITLVQCPRDDEHHVVNHVTVCAEVQELCQRLISLSVQARKHSRTIAYGVTLTPTGMGIYCSLQATKTLACSTTIGSRGVHRAGCTT